MSPVLSAELLDYILSFLQSDKATLKACSQSHPMLSQLVERHLYTDITIQDGTDEFLSDLYDRPYIANYVWILRIKVRESAMASLEELSPILPKLLMLRRIGLSCTGVSSCQWQMLPQNFCIAFLNCLRLPSITAVAIKSIAFPLSILSGCKHIRRLTLQFWRDPMAEGDNTSLPTIDSLALHDCWWSHNPSNASAISSWIASCCLSSLTFSNAGVRIPSHFDVLPQILTGCSHSLTSLDVDIDTSYGSLYDFDTPNVTAIHPNNVIPIPLSNLRSLQQFTIHARVYRQQHSSGSGKFSSPIFAITQILKPAPPFKRLILDFDSLFQDYEDAQRQIKNVLCISLHSLLVQSASTIDSIHLRFKSISLGSVSVSSKDAVSMFAGHSDLAQFVENGKLILTPVNFVMHS